MFSLALVASHVDRLLSFTFTNKSKKYATKNKSLDPLRANKIFIRKVENGPYLGLGYKRLISDPDQNNATIK